MCVCEAVSGCMYIYVCLCFCVSVLPSYKHENHWPRSVF